MRVVTDVTVANTYGAMNKLIQKLLTFVTSETEGGLLDRHAQVVSASFIQIVARNTAHLAFRQTHLRR